MSEFIPPYPKRHEKWPSVLDIIKYARQDLLSIWPVKAFQMQFNGMSIFNRGFFLANCPEAIEYVFVTHRANYGTKNPLMRKALAPLLGDNFDSAEQNWYKFGNAEDDFFTPAFASQHSEAMTKIMQDCVQHWSALKAGDKINVLPEMRNLTAAVNCRILLGIQLSEAQISQILSIFSQYQAAMEKMDISLLLGLPGWLPKFGGNQIAKTAKEVHQVIETLIALGLKNSSQESVLSHLLTLRDGEHPDGLTSTQLRNELTMLFMAGHETMSNTLAWAWYLISQAPEVEQKLHEELDSVLDLHSASFADLSQLTFTRAIIDETLRLYPPVPLLSREASADDTIRNHPIPAGSMMLVVPWLLQRHQKFWDKPDHFIPERFLADADTKMSEFSYLPFSGTPSENSAKFFGTIVATLSLASLAKKFRLAVPEGQQVMHECRLTLRPKDNLPMLITPR